jgi:hypothetical protein
MRKLVFVCLFLGLATQAYSQLNEKQLKGAWTYSVMTDQGSFTGVLNFEEKGGKLSGNVVSSDGQTWNMDKVELRKDNVVYFETTPQGETFKATLKIEGKEFKGTTGPSHTQFEVTGKKQAK